MNKEKIKFDKHEDMEKYLFDKYPVIFQDKNKDMSQSCMVWGINCGVGWFELLDKLCEEAQLIADTTGIQLVADQVKEKFGTLRFYWHTDSLTINDQEVVATDEQFRIWHNIIDDLVSQAEDKSGRTCEDCGEYGKVCGKGWLKTLCRTCADTDEQYKYDDKDEI